MTHRVFPPIPAGAAVQDADSSHMASGSFSLPTEEPPGQGHQDNDIKTSNSNNSITIVSVWSQHISLMVVKLRGFMLITEKQLVKARCVFLIICTVIIIHYQIFGENQKWKKQN